MKSVEKNLVFLGLIIFLITSFFPLILYVSYDYRSADSLEIYTAILIELIIFIFILLFKIQNLIRIIILSILNFSLLIGPGTIFYLYTNYGSSSSYIIYILNYLSIGSNLVWIVPPVLFNNISIILFIIEYKRTKIEREKVL